MGGCGCKCLPTKHAAKEEGSYKPGTQENGKHENGPAVPTTPQHPNQPEPVKPVNPVVEPSNDDEEIVVQDVGSNHVHTNSVPRELNSSLNPNRTVDGDEPSRSEVFERFKRSLAESQGTGDPVVKGQFKGTSVPRSSFDGRHYPKGLSVSFLNSTFCQSELDETVSERQNDSQSLVVIGTRHVTSNVSAPYGEIEFFTAEERCSKPGDYLLIRPKNSLEAVSAFANLYNISEDDLNNYFTMTDNETGDHLTQFHFRIPIKLRDALAEEIDLGGPPSLDVIRSLLQQQPQLKIPETFANCLRSSECFDWWIRESKPTLIDCLQMLEELPPLSLVLANAPLIQHRCYLVASGSPGRVSICYSLDTGPGLCSGYLQQLEAGDRVTGYLQQGGNLAFPVPSDNLSVAPVLMVAGYAGIAPFRGFLDQVKTGSGSDSDSGSNLYLLYEFQRSSEAPYLSSITADLHQGLISEALLVPVPNRPEEPQGLGLAKALLHSEPWCRLLPQLFDDSQQPRPHVYICGSTEFCKTLRTALDHVLGKNVAAISVYAEETLDHQVTRSDQREQPAAEQQPISDRSGGFGQPIAFETALLDQSRCKTDETTNQSHPADAYNHAHVISVDGPMNSEFEPVAKPSQPIRTEQELEMGRASNSSSAYLTNSSLCNGNITQSQQSMPHNGFHNYESHQNGGFHYEGKPPANTVAIEQCSFLAQLEAQQRHMEQMELMIPDHPPRRKIKTSWNKDYIHSAQNIKYPGPQPSPRVPMQGVTLKCLPETPRKKTAEPKVPIRIKLAGPLDPSPETDHSGVILTVKLLAVNRDEEIFEIAMFHDDPYDAGDLVAIRPQNSIEDVQRILSIYGIERPDDFFVLESTEGCGKELLPAISFKTMFAEELDLSAPPSLQLLRALQQELGPIPEPLSFASTSESSHRSWVESTRPNLFSVLDALELAQMDLPSLELLISFLTRIRPRKYCISSSLDGVLTFNFRPIRIEDQKNQNRFGLASGYLLRCRQRDHLNTAILPGVSLRLPDNASTPMILIAGHFGVTALRSVWETKRRAKSGGRIVLLYEVARMRQQVLYWNEIMERKLDGVVSDTLLTQRDDQSLAEELIQNYKWQALVRQLVADEAHILVAGPRRFCDEIRQYFSKLFGNSTDLFTSDRYCEDSSCYDISSAGDGTC